MSIGSLMSWNFVDRVRSRDFQYILHCVSSEEIKYCKVSGNNTLMKWKCLRVMYLLFLISSVLYSCSPVMCAGKAGLSMS